MAFVVDGTSAELIMFLQRYVYNLIRLFQQQGTYTTIMTYGRDQYRIASWVSFVSAQAVQVDFFVFVLILKNVSSKEKKWKSGEKTVSIFTRGKTLIQPQF